MGLRVAGLILSICNSRIANQRCAAVLKPQDLLITLRLLIAQKRRERVTYPLLSQWTGLSASETHAAVRRAAESGLFTRVEMDADGFAWRAANVAVEEFLFHGLKYVLPLTTGAITRGVPTGTAAPGMNVGSQAVLEGDVWVWPHAEGTVRGMAIEPLYRSAPEAAMKDEMLHQALASLDLIRAPNHRLRRLGEDWLRTNLLRS
jgi:hypothetical protein